MRWRRGNRRRRPGYVYGQFFLLKWIKMKIACRWELVRWWFLIKICFIEGGDDRVLKENREIDIRELVTGAFHD